MSKPLLAATLLIVMAGAWAWALWPRVPAPAGPPRAADAAVTATHVPMVQLARLGRGGPGIAADVEADPFRHRPGVVPRGPGTALRPGADAADVLPPSAPDPPRWPRLELIGVAEGQERGQPVRTAILSGATGVLHARADDVVEQVYRVERIAPDGVEVRLIPEDRILRLELRP